LIKDKIKSVLTNFDMTVRKLNTKFTTDYFVSGGCIGSLLRDEEPNDYDVFFYSKHGCDIITNLYINDPSFKNEVECWDEDYRGQKTDERMITENAVTLKNKVQLIIKNCGEPQEVRQTFDFVHCLPYYDTRTDKLYISREQFNLCIFKSLKNNDANTPSKKRVNKFLDNGWKYIL